MEETVEAVTVAQSIHCGGEDAWAPKGLGVTKEGSRYVPRTSNQSRVKDR